MLMIKDGEISCQEPMLICFSEKWTFLSRRFSFKRFGLFALTTPVAIVMS